MGRSRGNFQAADEDPSQRFELLWSRFHLLNIKKSSSTGENLESSSSGQGSGEGKKALYHCNYCNKDITGKIRIKCAMCPDYDLCIECFSIGAEVQPHKSNHSYRVMDNLSFPLMCPDWNADDEMLLLEGIEMYGLGNWAEVVEHVGTKNKEQCIAHYTDIYLNSPYFPLPDMSHVVGKNRKELLAMAKGHLDDRKGSSGLGNHTLKEDSPFSPSRVKLEEMHKGSPSGRLLESESAARVSNASNNLHVKGGPVKMEEKPSRNSTGKKPSTLGNSGPSLMESSGYNAKRQEFDPEYDNDAEQLLAEMEFKETDTEEERELKLRVLRIFSKRLDERKRRKDFVLERNLLHANPFFNNLSPEEIALCRTYDVYMRFHSKEEHEDLLQTVISEHRTLKRIQDLKEARAAGCRTSAEADRYLEMKRKREAEELSQRAKEGAQQGPSASGGASDLDIMGFQETQLLSESEKRLCIEIRLAPPVYMKMQQVISEEIFSGNLTKKTDAHHLFKMEPGKIEKVYDILVKKGLAPQ